MDICSTESDELMSVSSRCSLALWSALLPAIFVFILVFTQVPLPRHAGQLLAIVKPFFTPYMTVSEAEALSIQTSGHADVTGNYGDLEVYERPTNLVGWKSTFVVVMGVLEILLVLSHGAYNFYETPGRTQSSLLILCALIPWTYSVVRPLAYPITTAPYDLASLYSILFCSAILKIGEVAYDHYIFNIPLPSSLPASAIIVNSIIVFSLLLSVITIPMGYPSSRVDSKDIGHSVSPEDYCTLLNWVTFHWLYPVIRLGKHTTLYEKDVWALSPIMQSRPIFAKFSAIRRNNLFWHIIHANSFDIIFDFILTLASVVFNYAGPFFLKRILVEIEREGSSKESRANAYIYASLALICSLLKAQADAQHLWLGRRASIRLRSELMASIYDKALKRKDFSGVVSKDAKKDGPAPSKGLSKAEMKARSKAEKDKASKADDPKAGADIGKIVNLMSGDATFLAQMLSTIHIIYAAPFEIIIAGIFLYQLLGLSAFAGLFVLLVAWPLNRFLIKRSVRIRKGILVARDKRMSALNELIGAIKFIKFFAWEDRWIGRVLAERGVEMSWLVKARINTVMFQFLWACAPVFVSISAFYAYVMSGHQLTVSTAFTVIALFNMVKSPLNVIPQWTVNFLQAGLALDRIAVYLAEDEVTDQVCSLKKSDVGPEHSSNVDEGLGLDNATLTWNQVSAHTKGSAKVAKSRAALASGGTSETDTTDVSGDEGGDTTDERGFKLREVSVRFPEDKLTIVTGPTASGKTALLLAVLGEMTLLEGSIIMSKDTSRVDEHGLMHCISYASQTPWLRHQSIKDNILFGYPFDEERYNAVVECCALRPDLQQLEDGDATEIGARGINLSGGQKARVALARAVYARTKYVLLDDPLSAVDSHTSRFLYERLLLGPLLVNRTVVLVTHHVELVLPGADYVVQMLNGRIDTQGTVEDLRSAGILDSIAHHSGAKSVNANDTIVPDQEETAIPVTISKNGNINVSKPRKLVKDEHRETGGVKWSVYNSYLRASSYWTWSIIAIFVVVRQFLHLGEKLWIRVWGEAYEKTNFFDLNSLNTSSYSYDQFYSVAMQIPLAPAASNNAITTILSQSLPDVGKHPLFYVGVYAAISLAVAISYNLSGMVQFTGALRASRVLFKNLLETVVRATFRLHDTTPQGRILNRFGKDMEIIDSNLSGSLQAVNTAMAGFFSSIIIIGVIFPYFLVPAFLLGIVYRELALGYLSTGRDLRRMESNSRSPIYSDFGELLEGIVTVRAFSAERRFLDNLHTKVDNTTKMWYTFWMTNRWLLLNYDSLGAVAILVTTLISIKGLNDAGLAGICITSAMSFTNSIYWACRYWTTLELNLNAVERVIEYLGLPQEPAAVIPSNRAPAYWPSKSNNALVVVEDLEIKYAPELPAVLRGVSFSLRPGERVGILGRTGSGKSTLAMSLLRFVDPSGGRIVIDGIDISTIGTHDLRSRVTFIPQDATLFSGTLRENIDPFNEYDDVDCINTLQRVHLISDNNPASDDSRMATSSNTPLDSEAGSTLADSESAMTKADHDMKSGIHLGTKVSPGGTNFSQGQRQLIAMARALLRQSAIIILDEATSSIDFATDTQIQAAIRLEFKSSLLLTIAHRIRTVIDYDRLIILDKGEVAEFDTPSNLIDKEGGIFRDMCLKSGAFDELHMAAKNSAATK